MATHLGASTTPRSGSIQRAQVVKRLSEETNRLLWQARSMLRAVAVMGSGPAITANRVRTFSQETIRGFYTTRSIVALLNIGLLEEMATCGSVNIDAFATREKLDPKILKALCNYLYSLRIFTRDGETYALDPKRKFPLDAMYGPFHVVYAYEDVVYNLEALLKREKTYGVDVKRRSDFVAIGSGEVGQFLAFPMVADLIRRKGFQRVVDLGCGDGTFIMDQCERNSNLTGYGVDIAPEAIAVGQQKVQQRGLQNRVHLAVGDIFDIDNMADQLHGIDGATSIYVLHEFLPDGKERIVEMFRRFRAAYPGVALILCEVIRHSPEELREKPGGILEIQLFHDLSNQPLLSREEWKALFQEAGFTHVEEDYLSFARTALFTVK